MKNLNLIKNYRGLPRGVYILFFASVVDNIGDFVMPFLTFFLIYNVGLNAATVGIIVAANSAIAMVGNLIGGKLIDSKGRKSIYVIFRSLTAISIMSCAFIKNPYLITAILMLTRFFSGFSAPVYNTMMADLTTTEAERKIAFSLNYIAINVGGSVGPLIAGFLYKNYIKLLFIGDAITTFICIILVAMFIPETLNLRVVSEKDSKKISKTKEQSLWVEFAKRKNLVVFSTIIILFYITFSQFNFGLSLQIGDIFKEDMSKIFGILMTINSIMCATLTPILVSSTKDTSPSLSICLGGIFYAFGFGMLFFINSFYMFVISTILWTVGEILVSSNDNIYINKYTPDTHRGRFNSILPMARRIGFMVGPMMAGSVIKSSNIRTLWVFIAIISLLGSAMMYKLYISDKNKEQYNEVNALKESI